MRNYILPGIAVVLLSFAAFHLARSQQPRLPSDPPLTPPTSPFEQQVAGLGIVEARTENISIGSHIPGVVAKVLVKEGERVKAGQPLFELDTRQVQADVQVKQAMLDSAQAQLDKLVAMPRPEELPPMQAQLVEMEAAVKQREDTFARSTRIRSTGAVTEQTFVVDQQTLEVAKAQLERTKAQFDLIKAGAWQPDKDVARAAVKQAQAQLEQAQIELSRHRVTAPLFADEEAASTEWEVLKVNVRPGEYVGTLSGQEIIILGETGSKHVRVDIDESDIPRFQISAQAVAFVRGNNQKSYELKFVRTQPFVVPKKSLSGDSAERVDTRVLQVIYSLGDDDRGIYIGQQMDVFLKMAGG